MGATHAPNNDPKKNGNGKGGGGGGDEIDPIIQGLLARLPKAGDVWPEVERKLWLNLLEGSFKLIYKDGQPSTYDTRTVNLGQCGANQDSTANSRN